MHSFTQSLLSTALFGLLAGAAFAQAEPVRSTVELDGIENIHLLGSVNLRLSQGDEEYVTIIADRDYMDQVEARIKGDTLALGQKSRSFWHWFDGQRDREVRFEVQVRQLKHLANRGSGSVELLPFQSPGEIEMSVRGSGTLNVESLDVESLQLKVLGSGATRLERVEATQLALRLHGSGDVELDTLHPREMANGDRAYSKMTIGSNGSGNVRVGDGVLSSLDISVNGSGDINAGNLRVQEAKVKINGSGDVEVNASEALDVRINGSGDVLYRGQPADLQRSIKGSGDVQQQN